MNCCFIFKTMLFHPCRKKEKKEKEQMIGKIKDKRYSRSTVHLESHQLCDAFLSYNFSTFLKYYFVNVIRKNFYIKSLLHYRRNMAEILSILHKTPSNQSINQSFITCIINACICEIRVE